MPIWGYVLVYAIIVISYIAVHQIIFRYRFKELAFTLMFLCGVFFLLTIVTKFNDLMIWLMIVSISMLVLYAVYVSIIMRTMREKIQQQVMSGINIEEMFKSILKGDLSMQNEKPPTDSEDYSVEEVEETDSYEPEHFDIGDVIIDDSDEEQKDEKDKK